MHRVKSPLDFQVPHEGKTIAPIYALINKQQGGKVSFVPGGTECMQCVISADGFRDRETEIGEQSTQEKAIGLIAEHHHCVKSGE